MRKRDLDKRLGTTIPQDEYIAVSIDAMEIQLKQFDDTGDMEVMTDEKLMDITENLARQRAINTYGRSLNGKEEHL